MIKYEIKWVWNGTVEEVEIFDNKAEAMAEFKKWVDTAEAEEWEGMATFENVEYEWAWTSTNNPYESDWDWIRM